MSENRFDRTELLAKLDRFTGSASVGRTLDDVCACVPEEQRPVLLRNVMFDTAGWAWLAWHAHGDAPSVLARLAERASDAARLIAATTPDRFAIRSAAAAGSLVLAALSGADAVDEVAGRLRLENQTTSHYYDALALLLWRCCRGDHGPAMRLLETLATLKPDRSRPTPSRAILHATVSQDAKALRRATRAIAAKFDRAATPAKGRPDAIDVRLLHVNFPWPYFDAAFVRAAVANGSEPPAEDGWFPACFVS